MVKESGYINFLI